MALTPSNMLPLGTTAPNFSLLNPQTGTFDDFSALRGTIGTVVMFICNHCPYVIHIEQGIKDLAKNYLAKGISFIAISSNNIETHPLDAPEKMAEKNYPFPYLYDGTQAVAKAYNAACTPDIYLFDQNNVLVYRGQFDSARPKNEIPVTGEDLASALDSLLAGTPVSTDQKPSIGCNIKWRE
jgi:peroxiredoxin